MNFYPELWGAVGMSLLGMIPVWTGIAPMDGPTQAWYHALPQPWWTPPDNVFGPVWAVLYAMIGVALVRLWRAPEGVARTRALSMLVVHISLNLAWSPVFFGMRAVGTALVVLGMMLVTWWGTMVYVRHVDRTAAWLLVPYGGWLLFAASLNGGIWWQLFL